MSCVAPARASPRLPPDPVGTTRFGDEGRFGGEAGQAPFAQLSPARPGIRAPRRSSLVIQHPVRGGQRIHAAGGDLVVLGPVSIGAEISADGCIHVYGPLRGTASAGEDGDPDARIFARLLDPTRISIAGLWLGAEEMDPAWRGTTAQLRIVEGRLRLEPLP